MRDFPRNLASGEVILVAYQALDSEYEECDTPADIAKEQKDLHALNAGHYSMVVGVGRRYVWLADPHSDVPVKTKDGIQIPAGLRRMRHCLFMKR